MHLRRFLATMSFVTLTAALATAAQPDLGSIPLKNIDGKDASLKDYAGKVLLIVNVASKCGFTPQYEGLEALYKKYEAQGLVVLGFPSNDFGGQEPGTEADIKQFCSSKYAVTFPMFAKLHTKGPEQHPLYAALTGKDSPTPGDVGWNFNKYLISRDGQILQHFPSNVKPSSDELTKAVETALAKK